MSNSEQVLRAAVKDAIKLIEQYKNPEFYAWLLNDYNGQTSDPCKRATQATEVLSSALGVGDAHSFTCEGVDEVIQSFINCGGSVDAHMDAKEGVKWRATAVSSDLRIRDAFESGNYRTCSEAIIAAITQLNFNVKPNLDHSAYIALSAWLEKRPGSAFHIHYSRFDAPYWTACMSQVVDDHLLRAANVGAAYKVSTMREVVRKAMLMADDSFVDG